MNMNNNWIWSLNISKLLIWNLSNVNEQESEIKITDCIVHVINKTSVFMNVTVV